MFGSVNKKQATRRMLKKALASLGLAVLLALPSAAQATRFFSYEVQDPKFVDAVVLTNANAAAVQAYLAALPAGTPKAVTVLEDLNPNNPAVKALFNSVAVTHVFADYETGNVVARVAALKSLVGASTKSKNALVGNYALAPLNGSDPTRPPGNPGFSGTDYKNSKANMANESLYPGGRDFRNPDPDGPGPMTANGYSTAPNVRSALFVLPVVRAGLVEYAAPGKPHIPYVARFNNWGNSSLDSDGNPANGYQFSTTNQLLSRGDFSAQILHYRLRGADSVYAFQPGVVGYGEAMMQADITRGWEDDPMIQWVNQVFAGSSPTLTNVKEDKTIIDGFSQPGENKGVIFSGVANTKSSSGGAAQLAILLSNLDEQAHLVKIPSQAGKNLLSQLFAIEAGTHRLLKFELQSKPTAGWKLIGNDIVFADPDRSGTGVPEPGVLSLLVIGTGVGLLRRRRA